MNANAPKNATALNAQAMQFVNTFWLICITFLNSGARNDIEFPTNFRDIMGNAGIAIVAKRFWYVQSLIHAMKAFY